MPVAAARRYYIDTSAYLCILLAEAGGEALEKELAGAQLLSSVLLVLEASRNLIRLTRGAVLRADQYEICVERLRKDRLGFTLKDLTLDLCESSVMPAVATPRSLDLAHLRTAMWFHGQEPLTRFVTLDAGQAQAARDLGLPV